jgi:GH35 family endo-1,4-beta-xylanase
MKRIKNVKEEVIQLNKHMNKRNSTLVKSITQYVQDIIEDGYNLAEEAEEEQNLLCKSLSPTIQTLTLSI